MDAKAKSNFIKSVAAGRKIPCPNCSTLNDSDSRFCETCGGSLEAVRARQETAAASIPFAAVSPEPAVISEDTIVPIPVVPPAAAEVPEENQFANGLPAWNIDPPQTIVRRRKVK